MPAVIHTHQTFDATKQELLAKIEAQKKTIADERTQHRAMIEGFESTQAELKKTINELSNELKVASNTLTSAVCLAHHLIELAPGTDLRPVRAVPSWATADVASRTAGANRKDAS